MDISLLSVKKHPIARPIQAKYTIFRNHIEEVSLYLAELHYDSSQLEELYNEFTMFVESNEIDIRLSRTTSRRYETIKDYFIDVSI